ncbi:MAG: dipeptidase [Gammaproteobacteria bacterium]|nr:dipeptidase [Gammaproteobacteria bacterium]
MFYRVLFLSLVIVTPVLTGGQIGSAEIKHSQSGSSKNTDSAARKIHFRAFTIDTHIDVPENFSGLRLDSDNDGINQANIPKMLKGGLDFVFFSAAVGQRPRNTDAYRAAYAEAVKKISSINRLNDLYPEHISVATSPEQALDIHRAGKLVAAIGLENGFPIGKKIENLHTFHELGVSYITLTHLGHNDIADSANPVAELGDEETEHNGLSPFGRRVVAEMNRLGMMVDVSHASKKAMLDIVKASKAPVIASHSAVYELRGVKRNMDDEQLFALKKNGGVIQIVGYSDYLRATEPGRQEEVKIASRQVGLVSHMDWVNATNDQYIRYSNLLQEIDRRYPRATVQDFVDHIDYVVDLIGVDFVGIGSDFYAGGGSAVGGLSGWMDTSQSPDVTEELLRRGYTEEDVNKIWGGNLLRVWREVQTVGKESSLRK